MLASIIRTIVPVIVGALLGWAAKVGLNLPAGATTEILTVVLTAAYYTVARLLEQQFPQLGRILLSFGLTSAGSPVYSRVVKGGTVRLPRA
jgi:predicted permease